MRAVVVANPRATAMAAGHRRLVLDALGRAADVELTETAYRGHAVDVARQAMRERVDLVIAVGGDGTVNEVTNGLLTDGVHDDVPRMGIVPTGSTNVFARALGLPNIAADAVATLVDGLAHGRSRRVSLGRADERWFCFAAGFGFDAAVVAGVEEARLRGRRSTHTLYVRTAVRTYTARTRPQITLVAGDTAHPVTGLRMVIITNTDPWTYLGNRPVSPTPSATFDNGLSVYARTTMGLASVAKGVTQMLAPGVTPSGRGVVVENDLAEFGLVSLQPQPFQVDGDYLGLRSTIRFVSVPDALTVIC